MTRQLANSWLYLLLMGGNAEMRALDYKLVKGQKHLTYDTIRRFVLDELSKLSRDEANSHIQTCPRCRSIKYCLTNPHRAPRKGFSLNIPTKVWWAALILLLISGVVIAASVLFKPVPADPVSFQEPVVENAPIQAPVESEAAPVLEAIDTLSEAVDEPQVSEAVENKKFDNYIEKPQNQTRPQVRGIYGKITLEGQPVSGVTVMTPGSSRARLTDASGKYYIQVPARARSLIFIYQGKQLIKSIDSNSRRLDLQLNSENMAYPQRPEPTVEVSPDSIG